MTLPPIAILAGGLATRLHPVTKSIPKSLVQVCGEPFIAHQLRLLKRQGFENVVLLTGHLGEQIEAHVGAGTAFGLSVSYSNDGERQRGTGGAVRHALSRLGDVFFVLYGDSYLDIEIPPIWQSFNDAHLPALMTVLHNRDQWDPSNVVFDGKHVRRHDKSAKGQPGTEWIDYGLSVFSRELLASWPSDDPFDLSSMTSILAQQGQLAGHEVTRRFYEIGKPEGLAETESYIAGLRKVQEN